MRDEMRMLMNGSSERFERQQQPLRGGAHSRTGTGRARTSARGCRVCGCIGLHAWDRRGCATAGGSK